MKKFILLIVLSGTVSSVSYGQIVKGSLLFGGDFSGYSEKQLSNGIRSDLSGFQLTPLFGKAIKDNLFLGGFLNLGLANRDGNSGTIVMKNNIYGAGFFLRKYSEISNKFYGFFQGNLGINYIKQTGSSNVNSSNESKRTSFGVSLSPGLSYKISKKLHLESSLRELVSLGYSTQTNFSNVSGAMNSSKFNRVYFSSSLNSFSSNLSLGFRLLIEKRVVH